VRLTELKFSDLFLPVRIEEAWYKETPNALDRIAIPAELVDDTRRLRISLEDSAFRSPDFRIDFDGMRMRIERMDVSDASSVFVCRRYGVRPSSLQSLGFPGAISGKLLSPEIKDGLILFAGRTGSGKTTTAMALTLEWLSKYGGVCWTAENPVEIDISGSHGKGVCYQTEVPDDRAFGEAIVRMLRASPNLIMVGEIRDEYAARQAIHAATSGHLVISTFHANDITSGLARFADKARDNHGLADALRAILHLTLKIDELAPQKRILIVEPLLVVGSAASGIRATLRSGDFHLLKSEIERQRRLFMSGELP